MIMKVPFGTGTPPRPFNPVNIVRLHFELLQHSGLYLPPRWHAHTHTHTNEVMYNYCKRVFKPVLKTLHGICKHFLFFPP